MSFRHFDPQRDAVPALHGGWLHLGERLVWYQPNYGHARYRVTRRTGDGTVVRHPFWRGLGWALISPFWLAMWVHDAIMGFMGGSEDPPPIVFGSRGDCLAARLADASEYRTFWVLTDRRLAMVSADPPGGVPQSTLERFDDFALDLGRAITGAKHTLPVEPVHLRTVWDLGPNQFVHDGFVRRRWIGHDRIRFPDGSGVDLPR